MIVGRMDPFGDDTTVDTIAFASTPPDRAAYFVSSLLDRREGVRRAAERRAPVSGQRARQINCFGSAPDLGTNFCVRLYWLSPP